MKNPRIPLAARAGETANRLLRLMEKDRLVERFVAGYIAENKRRGLTDDPARLREMVTTIGREVLLVMAERLTLRLPRYLPKPKPKRARRHAAPSTPAPTASPADLPPGDIFLTEFYASLGRALRWTPADAEEFLHDLEIYSQLVPREKTQAPRRTGGTEGAFVDRCALLLDPSMFENARHAARRFQGEVERLADRTFAGILRRR